MNVCVYSNVFNNKISMFTMLTFSGRFQFNFKWLHVLVASLNALAVIVLVVINVCRIYCNSMNACMYMVHHDPVKMVHGRYKKDQSLTISFELTSTFLALSMHFQMKK